jgi:hypothetical protein
MKYLLAIFPAKCNAQPTLNTTLGGTELHKISGFDIALRVQREYISRDLIHGLRGELRGRTSYLQLANTRRVAGPSKRSMSLCKIQV